MAHALSRGPSEFFGRLVDQWHPHTGWRSVIEPAWEALMTDGFAPESQGWKAFAMLFGDTGAPEACLLVSLHAHLAAHGRLAASGLGLTRWTGLGPVPLAALEVDEAWSGSADDLEGWAREALVRWHGDLPAAVRELALLAARAMELPVDG